MTLNQNSFGPFRLNFVATMKTLQSAICQTVCQTICLMICLAFPSLAQNIQHTQNTADASLRGNLQVDPSTLGMSLQIPLGEYAGRNGLNIPISVSYGSKAWRVHTFEEYTNGLIPVTRSNAMYSERSMSGWTGSLDLPTFEFLADNQPFLPTTGDAMCLFCEPPPSEPPYYIERLLITMPDGSSHEVRKSPTPLPRSSIGLGGIYYAVDGSRLKYDADTNTIYLPDGAR